MKKKLLIIGSIIIAVAIMITTIIIIKRNSQVPENDNDNGNIYYKETEDQTKVNISKEFSKTKEFEGFRISNIKFTEKDKEVLLIADVKNISGKDIEKLTYFNITFFDSENKEIGSFPGVINSVKSNETTTLNSSVNGDIANYINAYDFKIELDKSR